MDFRSPALDGEALSASSSSMVIDLRDCSQELRFRWRDRRDSPSSSRCRCLVLPSRDAVRIADVTSGRLGTAAEAAPAVQLHSPALSLRRRLGAGLECRRGCSLISKVTTEPFRGMLGDSRK